MSQWRCDTKIAFNVPASAFTPPPKVESTLVHFESLKQPKVPAEVEVLEFVVSKAFNQRRKMLRVALKGYFQNCIIDFLPASIFRACVPCTLIVINLKSVI